MMKEKQIIAESDEYIQTNWVINDTVQLFTHNSTHSRVTFF